MSAAQKIATVTRLPTAAKRAVRQPGVPHNLPKWGEALAGSMADQLPAHRRWLVGTTFDPKTFDDLTWFGVHGWRGDNRSPWDRYVLDADRMLRSRGLALVGCATRMQEHGTLACVFLYRGGDAHDLALVGEHLRHSYAATTQGRPYLRRIA